MVKVLSFELVVQKAVELGVSHIVPIVGERSEKKNINTERLEKIILEKNGLMLISADHGNVECMLDHDCKPHTSHTTNPVPLILVGKNVGALSLENGGLNDIAPTILHLLKIEKPCEMDGKNLIKN